MGMAFATVRTPPPTIPTIIDVVEDELCITEVTKIPINKPTMGLDVELISVSANPFPNNLSDDPIRSILNRNR
jgi:hypothetical protein